jgi:hypothetical protein
MYSVCGRSQAWKATGAVPGEVDPVEKIYQEIEIIDCTYRRFYFTLVTGCDRIRSPPSSSQLAAIDGLADHGRKSWLS